MMLTNAGSHTNKKVWFHFIKSDCISSLYFGISQRFWRWRQWMLHSIWHSKQGGWWSTVKTTGISFQRKCGFNLMLIKQTWHLRKSWLLCTGSVCRGEKERWKKDEERDENRMGMSPKRTYNICWPASCRSMCRWVSTSWPSVPRSLGFLCRCTLSHNPQAGSAHCGSVKRTGAERSGEGKCDWWSLIQVFLLHLRSLFILCHSAIWPRQ